MCLCPLLLGLVLQKETQAVQWGLGLGVAKGCVLELIVVDLGNWLLWNQPADMMFEDPDFLWGWGEVVALVRGVC